MSTLSAASRAAASALAVERTRIEAAVSNLANAESTRSADGKPYRRRDVVLRAEPVEGFQAALGRSTATGVKVAAIPGFGPSLDMFLHNNGLDWITEGLGLNFYFGGTSLLIVVGVAMDTVAQIEAQLIMRHYEGFTGRGGRRIRGRR